MTVLSASAQAAPAEGRGHFFGSKWEYRRILWGSMLALIVTLGLHRFTVTTNIRRYLWSRTDLAGEQLDYTGEPLDLLLGFLVLIVVLAPVLVAIAVFDWVIAAGRIPFVSIMPLLLLGPVAVLALYQARRYRLNHTVFRGLRFRQTGSALVFVLRILVGSAIVIVTFGVAYPWARADLERYKMRHTHYGDLQGSFTGSGWTLFRRGFVAWLIWAVLGLTPLFLINAAFNEDVPGDEEDMALLGFLMFAMIWLLILALVFFPVFRAIVMRWRIAGMRFGALSFDTSFSTWRFVKPYLKFYGWMVLIVIIVSILSIVVQATIVPLLPIGRSVTVEIIGVVCLVVAYFSIATVIAFAFQGTVRFETWRLIVDSLVLRGVDQLDRVKAPATLPTRREARTDAALNLGGL